MVCPLDRWLDDGLLRLVAAENNLSGTAFFVPDGDSYDLRWLMPGCEVVWRHALRIRLRDRRTARCLRIGLSSATPPSRVIRG